MKITISDKSNESAPIVIDTASISKENATMSTENTTLNFPKLASKETGVGKAFGSMDLAMKSPVIKTLIGEINGWIKRQNKYQFASKAEALENKQAILNRYFSYDRKTAANNARKIEFANVGGTPLVLFIGGYGATDYVLVFCPIVNTINKKVIYKPCGHFYIKNSGEMVDTSYESILASQESLIGDLITGAIN